MTPRLLVLAWAITCAAVVAIVLAPSLAPPPATTTTTTTATTTTTTRLGSLPGSGYRHPEGWCVGTDPASAARMHALPDPTCEVHP